MTVLVAAVRAGSERAARVERSENLVRNRLLVV